MECKFSTFYLTNETLEDLCVKNYEFSGDNVEYTERIMLDIDDFTPDIYEHLLYLTRQLANFKRL